MSPIMPNLLYIQLSIFLQVLPTTTVLALKNEARDKVRSRKIERKGRKLYVNKKREKITNGVLA